MPNLTQDLGADERIVYVDGPLLVGKSYTLDDEVVTVRGSVTETYSDVVLGNRWRVSRGEDNTDPAAHSSGATMSIARAYGAAGGEQIVRLLGPFAVDFDTDGIANDGVISLTALAASTLVFAISIRTTTPWVAGGEDVTISVGVGGPDWDDPDFDYAAVATIFVSEAVNTGGNGYRLSVSTTNSATTAYLTGAGVLTCQVASNAEPPTAGASQVYALIAEPA